MNKNNKLINNKPKPKPQNKIINSKKPDTTQSDLFDKVDTFLSKYSKIFFWIGFFITAIFSFLLFDFKVSDGGDDSAYIVRAYEFINKGIFPAFQGPLYPMMLGIFVLFFGIKVTLLKFLSFFFILGQYFFLYKALNKRISATLQFSMLYLISICSSLLYFASQTYSEAFFMFLLAIFMFFVMKYVVDRWDFNITFKNDWNKYFILGLLLVFLTLSKNIGLAIIIGFVIFLLSYKKWKQALFTVGGFLIIYLPLELLKRFIWKEQMNQIAAQGKTLLLKDYYSPVKGNEDFAGFINRFIDNSHNYLSKHLFVFLGLKENEMNNFAQKTPFLTIVVFAIGIVALILLYKKSKPLFLTTLIAGTVSVITFFVIQANWDQPRIIIILYPLFLLMIMAFFYYLLKNENLKKIQFLYFIILGILFFTSFKDISNKTAKHSKILKANLSGNLYYGLTPDWVNYIEMSKYVEKNIPKEDLVACRKPEISFVYTSKEFYGIYTIPSIPLDTFLFSIKNIQKPNKLVCLDIEKINSDVNVQQTHQFLSKYTKAFINANLLDENKQLKESEVIGVYEVPANIADSIIPFAQKKGVIFVDDVESVLQKVNRENWNFAIQDPEAMLKTLKDNNVKYFILASLRKYQAQNTGEVISTLHRYFYFIQLKYPNIATLTHTIGSTEPSLLYKLNY